jgi:GNAT superfamily N-acetyltransferase
MGGGVVTGPLGFGANRDPRGVVHDGERPPGFLALMEGRRVGLITYRIEGAECEIVNLNSLVEGMGVGSALVEAVRKVATSTGCRRLWLITTNDNMAALRFYQTRGFQLVAVDRNALEESRRLKPEIALVGLDGIPLRDEIELELLL